MSLPQSGAFTQLFNGISFGNGIEFETSVILDLLHAKITRMAAASRSRLMFTLFFMDTEFKYLRQRRFEYKIVK